MAMCGQVDACPNCKLRTAKGSCVGLENSSFKGKCPFYKKGDHKEFITHYKLWLDFYKREHKEDKRLEKDIQE